MKQLTYPAPRRMSVRGEEGKYHTRPYLSEDVKQVLSYGGWFRKGCHDFQHAGAATLARAI